MKDTLKELISNPESRSSLHLRILLEEEELDLKRFGEIFNCLTEALIELTPDNLIVRDDLISNSDMYSAFLLSGGRQYRSFVALMYADKFIASIQGDVDKAYKFLLAQALTANSILFSGEGPRVLNAGVLFLMPLTGMLNLTKFIHKDSIDAFVITGGKSNLTELNKVIHWIKNLQYLHKRLLLTDFVDSVIGLIESEGFTLTAEVKEIHLAIKSTKNIKRVFALVDELFLTIYYKSEEVVLWKT